MPASRINTLLFVFISDNENMYHQDFNGFFFACVLKEMFKVSWSSWYSSCENGTGRKSDSQWKSKSQHPELHKHS